MLLFTDRIDFPRIKLKKESYISGPEICETTHPVPKGGFQSHVYKLWSMFNDTFVWYELPKVISHTWESRKRTCSFNENCTSFDYCISKETSASEIFQCNMKRNTLPEMIIKIPNHCVKSMKQRCRLL